VGEQEKVLVVEIDESSDKPHEALDEKGNRTVYVRANDQTTPVSKEMSQILDKTDKAVESELLEQQNVKYLMVFLKKNKKCLQENTPNWLIFRNTVLKNY
jgi:hypothetical protein